MTRKFAWVLVFCIAPLAILPGCQHLPSFANPSQENKTIVENPVREKAPVKEAIQSFVEEPAPIARVSSGFVIPAVHLPDQREPDEPKPFLDPLLVKSGPRDRMAKSPELPEAKDAVSLPEVVDNKRDFTAVLSAFKAMLEDRPQEAIKHLRAYDDKTQEFLLRFLPTFTILVKKPFDELTPQEVAVLSQAFRGMLVDLRSRSELVVSKMCYCKRIHGFGAFEALPENHAFLTGTEERIGERVQLYVELQNFVSERTKDGDYLTKLACNLELHDTNGKKVWSRSYDGNDMTIRRSARMNDFFGNYSFFVPAIPAGTYQLTIHIADETNPKQRRVASESLVFRVTPVAIQPPLR